jgi:WD40 repeat protein
MDPSPAVNPVNIEELLHLDVKFEVSGRSSAADPPEYKYWAFISYSHRDKEWADWLHQKLEGYHVPRALVGRASRNGPLPARLIPIFRDRDELSAAYDLGLYIKSSLVLSRHVVVICSPNSFKSKFVDEEIRFFKSLGRDDRIFCLIVEGEPGAADKLGDASRECFPPATQFRVGPDGRLSQEPASPIAADARPEGDGKSNALIKILAGLLEVNFDELKQREKVRRFRHRVQWTALAGLVIAGFFGIWKLEENSKQLQTTNDYLDSEQQWETNGKLKQASVYLAAAYRLAGGGAESDPQWQKRLAHDSRGLLSETAILSGDTNWVDAVVFSPDGKKLLTASWDSSLRIWDLSGLPKASSVAINTSKQNANDVFLSANYSPSGNEIVCTTWWSALCWITNANGDLIGRTINDHRGRVNYAEFNAQGDKIVTASDDCTARLWKTDGTPVTTLSGHTAGVKTAVFNARGTQVLTASYDGTAIVWDLASAKPVTKTAPHKADPKQLNCAAFNPDGETFVTAGLDGKPRIYDLTGKRLLTFSEHHARINSAVFSHSGSLVLTASDDGTAKIWNAKDGTLQFSLEGHKGTVLSASFSPDDTMVATTGNDYTVRLWRLNDAPAANISWADFCERVAALPWVLDKGQITDKNPPKRHVAAD